MSNNVPVAISARHAHLSEVDFKILFGDDKELTVKAPLGQPGQFASNEMITVVGDKGQLNLRILGPFRPETQVEVSKTEARQIGLNPPTRESGHLDGSPGITVKGPEGEISICKGVIIAKRHIHATNEDAKNLDITDQEIVMVKITSDDRSLIFDDVVVRVSDSYALECHIDTDEANAAGIAGTTPGEVIKK